MVLVSLAVRRFGPRVGGVIGGLPVVAGPIVFIYALEHGTRFAAAAATKSLVALIALTGFVLTVAFTAPRLGAVRSVVVGWGVFAVIAAIVARVPIPPVLGLLLTCAAFTGALAVMPHPDPQEVAQLPRRPRHDLALRAGVAASMVVVLTSIAARLGPAASGVLAPFPTITSVLAGFSVAHESRATTLYLLRGMVRGFFSFAAFLFVVAVTVEPWGIAAAFTAAIVATVAVQAGLLVAGERRRVALA